MTHHLNIDKGPRAAEGWCDCNDWYVKILTTWGRAPETSPFVEITDRYREHVREAKAADDDGRALITELDVMDTIMKGEPWPNRSV